MLDIHSSEQAGLISAMRRSGTQVMDFLSGSMAPKTFILNHTDLALINQNIELAKKWYEQGEDPATPLHSFPSIGATSLEELTIWADDAIAFAEARLASTSAGKYLEINSEPGTYNFRIGAKRGYYANFEEIPGSLERNGVNVTVGGYSPEGMRINQRADRLFRLLRKQGFGQQSQQKSA